MIYLRLGIVSSMVLHALFNIQSDPRVRNWLGENIEDASDFTIIVFLIACGVVVTARVVLVRSQISMGPTT